jgi:hypothetical protein
LASYNTSIISLHRKIKKPDISLPVLGKPRKRSIQGCRSEVIVAKAGGGKLVYGGTTGED